MRNRKIRTDIREKSPTYNSIDDETRNHGIKFGGKCTICLVTGLTAFFVVTQRMSLGKQRVSLLDTQPVWLPEASRRFPRYGTPEFTRQCNWTMYPPGRQDCTLLLRPPVKQNEGLAEWVSKAASVFIAGKLKGGCQLLVDYGPSVDIHQVVVPHDDLNANNWTIPNGFTECNSSNKCSKAGFRSYTRETVDTLPKQQLQIPIPQYRYAFTGTPSQRIYRKTFRLLETTLPGFSLQTGMACALTSLFQLSPEVSQFEPELESHILPKLRDERNLVFTVYARTNHADHLASAEMKGDVVVETTAVQRRASKYLHCVVDLEKEYMANSSQPSFSRIVWMVISDSPLLKEWIVKEYTSPNVNSAPSSSANVDGLKHNKPLGGLVIPREIITTTSRGIHTRAARNPSTSDFAAGMIDWFLIGESDVVFTNGLGYSYGTTGALRTNRPLYNFDDSSSGTSCSKKVFVHDEEPPANERQHFIRR